MNATPQTGGQQMTELKAAGFTHKYENGFEVWRNSHGEIVGSNTLITMATAEAYAYYLDNLPSIHDIAAVNKQAPAPVDILKEKNERIAALEKAVTIALALLESISFPNQKDIEAARTLSLALKPAPHAAPVQAEAVTLTESEIEEVEREKIVNSELELCRFAMPSHYNPIDAETAVEFPCDNCNSHNMHYEGFKSATSYRAFAVCDDCGFASEF